MIDLPNQGFETGRLEPWTAIVTHEWEGRDVSKRSAVYVMARYDGLLGYRAQTVTGTTNQPPVGCAYTRSRVRAILYQTVRFPQPRTGQFTFAAWVRASATGTVVGAASRVGIDPTGGTDPDAATVVWTEYDPSFNQWVRPTVTLPAQTTDRLTVFVEGQATGERTDCQFPADSQHLYATVYADEARLADEYDPPPSVTLTSPPDGDPPFTRFTVDFNAADSTSGPLARCRVLIDDKVVETIEPCPQGDQTVGPYYVLPGIHTVRVQVRDAFDTDVDSETARIEVLRDHPHVTSPEMGNAFARDVEAAPDGGVCLLVDWPENHFTIRKYDAHLTLQWESVAAGEGVALAVTDDRVYVTGTYPATDGTKDILTLCYRDDGTAVWRETYSYYTLGTDEEPTAIVADDLGNVWVAGTYLNPDEFSAKRALILKYESDGALRWDRNFSDAEVRHRIPVGIALDPSGNVVAAGTSWSLDYHGDPYKGRWFAIKCYPDGNTVWERQYEGPGGDDRLAGADTDASGNTALTGGSKPFYGDSDILTMMLSPGGTILWSKRYNGIANGTDNPIGVRFGASGAVYVAGTTNSKNVSKTDYCVIKYAPNGDRLRVRRYDGVLDYDEADNMNLDESENVYVGGSSQGVIPGVNQTIGVVVYSSDGVLIRLIHDDEPTSSDFRITTNAQGSVYATGKTRGSSRVALAKYPAEGAVLYGRVGLGAFAGDPAGLPYTLAVKDGPTFWRRRTRLSRRSATTSPTFSRKASWTCRSSRATGWRPGRPTCL